MQQSPASPEISSNVQTRSDTPASIAGITLKLELLDRGLVEFAPKLAKAAACLAKDRTTLLTHFDFPAEHCKPLRISNPLYGRLQMLVSDQRSYVMRSLTIASTCGVFKLGSEDGEALRPPSNSIFYNVRHLRRLH